MQLDEKHFFLWWWCKRVGYLGKYFNIDFSQVSCKFEKFKIFKQQLCKYVMFLFEYDN